MEPGADVLETAALFASIQQAFPHLTMRLDRAHPQVDLSLDIPCQTGLAFAVNVNLHGDELFLSLPALSLSWFPCTDADKVAQFREAVHGLLSGRFRILQHLRGSRVVGSELQAPTTQGLGDDRHLALAPPALRGEKHPGAAECRCG